MVSSAPELPKADHSPTLWRLGISALSITLLLLAAQKTADAFKHEEPATLAATPQTTEPTGLEGIIAPPVSDAQATPLPERPPTILLRGQAEAIIGQMAKIPAENEQITETKAVTVVDNHAGRELLSIISKY